MGEEARKAKVVRLSEPPPKEEVEEHMATHTPFRSWCKHCVKGMAVSSPHVKVEQEEEGLTKISLDYMWMEEKGAEEGMPILLMRDKKSGTINADVVPANGRN